jgi:hypothetical protein
LLSLLSAPALTEPSSSRSSRFLTCWSCTEK